MVLVNQTHVITPTNDPLEALVEGTHYKAYLVANLAFKDSPEASAEHYRLTISQVYSAMVFYRDNEEAIEKNIRETREHNLKTGARDASEHLAEIRARATKKS